MDAYVGPGALAELVFGALRLNPETYREAARSSEATKLSVAVAAIAGAATAPIIGAEIRMVTGLAMAVGIVSTLVIVATEASLLWLVLRLTLTERRSFGQVVRPLALAEAPRLAYLLVPLIGYPTWLALVISTWAKASFLLGVGAAVGRGWWAAIAAALAVGGLLWGLNVAVESL